MESSEKAAIAILLFVVAWMVLSHLNIHAGSGDELANRNNGFNVSISLFGDSTIGQTQDGAHK